MRPIEETVVLITGATDGLGRGVARDLAARGARVLLHGRDRAKLAALGDELGGAPHASWPTSPRSTRSAPSPPTSRPRRRSCTC